MRFNSSSITAWIIAALSLTNPVKKFLEVYFWDSVVHLVTSDPLIAVAKEYGPAFALLVIGAYFSVGTNDRAILVDRAKRRTNVWVVITAAGGIALVVGIAGYFWDRARGPIIWTYGTVSMPLALNWSSSGPVYVFAFQIGGKNRWDRPITPTDGYFESNIDNERIPATWSRAPIQSGTISPGAEFELVGILPSDSPSRNEGLSINEFRKRFASFTFVFKSSEHDYAISFDEHDTDRYIAMAENESSKKPPPSVIIKQ